MNKEHDDLKALETSLMNWHVPPPSPWLKSRATQHLTREATASRGGAWPLAPLRLVTASLAVAVIGIVLGLAAPNDQSFALEDTTEEMDTAMDMVIGEPANLDGADLIDVMW